MSITTFTLLGDCLSQLRLGMLRYQIGIRKTRLLSVQREDLTGDQMELCCRSVRHYGSRCPEGSHCTLLKEDCGKSQACPDDVLYFITYASIVLSAIDVVMLFLQCNPPHAAWDRSIPHICWSPNVLAGFSCFVGGTSLLISTHAKLSDSVKDGPR